MYRKNKVTRASRPWPTVFKAGLESLFIQGRDALVTLFQKTNFSLSQTLSVNSSRLCGFLSSMKNKVTRASRPWQTA